MSPSTVSIEQLLDEFRPGRLIVIPGASGELAGLQAALVAHPARLRGVELVCPLIPGMNSFDYAALHPDVRLTTFLLPPALRGSFEGGRVRVMPIAYSAIARYLAALKPDLAILHLTPPNGGVCSFGVCGDFGPIVAATAQRCIGVINSALPRPVHAPTIQWDRLCRVVEAHEPLRPAVDQSGRSDLAALARQVADLIPDGATIQTGIGAAPAAVWAALHGHKGLHLRSGLVTDGFLEAHDAGAMAPDGHLAGVAYGSSALYERLDGTDLVRFGHAGVTHGDAIRGLDGFFAINSAVEVDLFGQANLEWQDGRLISGVGGAPDFNRAARSNTGGRGVIALPSTARKGAVSRISVRLSAPAPSLSRSEIDTIVTEHGAAHLANLSVQERAQALIGIADPRHRDALHRDWAILERTL